ncbi:MAG: hypothetical protein GY864_00570 [Desulfobacterales bacterium]|nr:hypothetical protein [Desulfobacterales bacterium]
MEKFLKNFARIHKSSKLSIWSNDLVVPKKYIHLFNKLEAPNGSFIEILKQGTRRSVLRIKNFSEIHESMIVKGFPLNKIESRLKYRKYGLAEFINYHHAKEAGIPIPECHAYFEVRKFGLVEANGLLIEDLSEYVDLETAGIEFPEKRLELLKSGVLLLKTLFEKGVNHIDTTPQNILLSRDGKDMKLIDWQYVSFVQSRLPIQLILQARQFMRYGKLSIRNADGLEWLQALYDNCRPEIESHIFLEVMNKLEKLKKVSIDDRLNLRSNEDIMSLIA